MARRGSDRRTFGDDKDRVIYRTTGEPTYFAADIGYVTEKFSRGYDKLIYIWGADHHGTVARVRNAAKAMGFDIDAVEMLLVAWVRFVRDGQEVSMSKRAGEFITLDELLAEVGVDAARWSFAARAPSSPIDFDIELARKQSADNPVYYVQYAHARICSILRKAAEAGIAPSASLAGALAEDAVAAGLAREVLRLPEVVEDAAAAEETHAVTAYATGLATTFHALLPRPTRRRSGGPGHLRPSTGARRRGAAGPPQHPRPAGHLDPRTDVGPASQPVLHPSIVSAGGALPPAVSSRRRASRSTCWSVSWLLATTTSTGVVQAPRDICAGQHRVGTIQVGHRSVDGGAELIGVRAAVPRRLPDHGPRAIRSVEADEAIATPAIRRGRGGSRCRCRRAASRTLMSSSPIVWVVAGAPSRAPSAAATSGRVTLTGASDG